MSRKSQAPPGNTQSTYGYRVTGPIGAGARTLLEEAVAESGRVVALKRARRGASVARVLLNEAQVLSRLGHPNVVTYFEVVGPDHDPILVLERLRGQSLRALLEAQVRLDLTACAKIACDLAEALAHVHSAGVVHGDVSAANVMITDDGVVKLIDFGSARLHDSVTAQTSFATPGYVAPERLLGEPGDARSDLFSLGVVLYEMLTGRLPWDPTSDGSARAMVPLGQHLRAVPRWLDLLVRELLARNPADRPASAEEVAELLSPRVGTLSPRGLRQRLRGVERGGEGTWRSGRELATRYAAVLGVFVLLATLLRLLFGEQVARADVAGVLAGSQRADAGQLLVVAAPWAEVWVDGEHVETTPFAAPLAVAPGIHTLTLKHPMAAPFEQELSFEAGSTRIVQHRFPLSRLAPKPSENEDGPQRREKMP